MQETYTTTEQCHFIKMWLLKNEDCLKFTGISKKAGLNEQFIYVLLNGPTYETKQESVNKLLDVIYESGFSFPKHMSNFEFIICEETSIYFNSIVKISDLSTSSRKKHIVCARNLCMVYRMKVMEKSQREASEPYGKDHSIAFDGKQKIHNHYETDKKFREFIQKIEKRIGVELVKF